MSKRTPPDWFSLTDYSQQDTVDKPYNHPQTAPEWFHALNTRRQTKCLFDLLNGEPELFKRGYDKQLFWSNFQTALAHSPSHSNPSKLETPYKFQAMPARLKQYEGYRILALFDVVHWHEVMQLPLPNNSELQAWIYPDLDRVSRYVVNDAKKTLKLGMMECDALLYFESECL